ncbi:MAG: translation initiation factor IF-1 [Alphaproteobacteria bacterium]|nr:translation initiation factor IF-1 [Rickettsiales bacterium]
MKLESKKDDVLTLIGTVLERLPNANFRVKLENEQIIICHTSGKIKRNKINIVIGDPVVTEISVYDLSKGRIILRGLPREQRTSEYVNNNSNNKNNKNKSNKTRR